MNPKYINTGLPEDRVIEECAEVIQAITKIKRFGMRKYHPDRPESNNRLDLLSEIEDLKFALEQYEKCLNSPHIHFIDKPTGQYKCGWYYSTECEDFGNDEPYSSFEEAYDNFVKYCKQLELA